jgi:hypothetical protein
MFAVNVNLTVAEGFNVSKEAILPLTQRFWGITFEGIDKLFVSFESSIVIE